MAGISENLVKWVDAANGQVPRRSEIGGMDLSGEIIYVGRAKFSGGLLPGKIVPSHGVCYVSHKGHEHAVCNYQALVKNKLCDSMWVAASKGSIPADALRGGLSAKHKPLYIARAFMYYHGAAAMGTVNLKTGACSVPYDGLEVCLDKYEVLVVKPVFDYSGIEYSGI